MEDKDDTFTLVGQDEIDTVVRGLNWILDQDTDYSYCTLAPVLRKKIEDRNVTKSDIEFQAWPKIARLNREVIITEKLDGTNSAVIITEDGGFATQSRSRITTPGKETDNYGFARWALENKDALIKALGPGRHFGEWWGSGIQRGYGLKGNDKRFSLFNINRYKDVDFSELPNVGLVPAIFGDAPNDLEEVPGAVRHLIQHGSIAAPGYMDPEGVVVYHTAADTLFKVTCKNDEKPKGSTE